MINVGPSSGAVVYTATSPGIHVFTLVAGSTALGSTVLSVNGESIDSHSAVNRFPAATPVGHVQQSYHVYLNVDDTVEYTGPAAQLAAVRLGDEL